MNQIRNTAKRCKFYAQRLAAIMQHVRKLVRINPTVCTKVGKCDASDDPVQIGFPVAGVQPCNEWGRQVGVMEQYGQHDVVGSQVGPWHNCFDEHSMRQRLTLPCHR